MSKIDDALQQLITAVLDSEVYREFDMQRDRMNQHPELKAKVDEFRERVFELQTSDDNGFDKMEQVENEYSEFIEDSLGYDFLTAELALCRMMQDLNMRLTEAIDFE